MTELVPLTTAAPKPRLYELDSQQLAAWCEAHGFPKYRAEQIRRWIFGRRVNDFNDMHDLPAALRKAMTDEFSLFPATVDKHLVGRDRTEKLLLQLHDGQFIECVLMRETDRRTVCISTQVGCAMGCVFCASGMLGLKRNLSTGEILEQVLLLDRLLAKGEQITISTVGLPDKIRELAKSGKQYNLAVSLHAPNDVIRDKLVPVNDKIGMAAILRAADDYFEITGRRVTYEYVLLSGVNDDPQHARMLAKELQSRIAHVNLIPMNGVTELPFVEPSDPRTHEFVAVLESFGIPATVRKRKGADIDAACGQLRLMAETK
jgi:23S rRNA (adenine2503-C2)-methyltransferase